MAKNNNFRIAKFVFASQIFTLSTANDFLPPKIMIDLPCQESIDFRYFYFCQKNITFGVTLVSRMCVSFVWRGFHVIRFESALLSITNWAIPILFFVYFWSFQTSDTIFQRVNVKKCPSSLWWWDSKPRPLEHESSPVTSWLGPRLNVFVFVFLLTATRLWSSDLRCWKQLLCQLCHCPCPVVKNWGFIFLNSGLYFFIFVFSTNST